MAAGSIVVDLLMRTGSFETDTARAQASLKKLKKEADDIGQKIGLAFSAAAIGLTYLVKSTIDSQDHLNDLAQKAGVTAETMGGIGFAAKQAGLDIDSVSSGIGKLNKSVAEASAGSAQAQEAFTAMGISVKDAAGNTKAADVVLGEIADKFASYADGPEKAALAVRIFGKAGADMIPLLNGGSQALSDQIAYFQRYSGVTNETAKAADQFNDTLVKLNLLAGAFGKELTASLLGPLQAVVDRLVEAKENGTGFKGVAEAISGTLKTTAETASFVVESLAAMSARLSGLIETIQAFDKAASDTRANQSFFAKLIDPFGTSGIGDKVKRDFAGIGKLVDAEVAAAQKRHDRFVAALNFKVNPEDYSNEGRNRPKPKGAAPKLPGDKPAASDFDALFKRATEEAASARASLAELDDTGVKLTEAQKIGAKVAADYAAGLLKITPAQLQIVQATLADADATEKLIQKRQDEIRWIQEATDANATYIEQQQHFRDQLLDQVKASEIERASYGLTRAELDRLATSRMRDAAAALEQKANQADASYLDDLAKLYREQAQAIRDSADARDELTAKEEKARTDFQTGADEAFKRFKYDAESSGKFAEEVIGGSLDRLTDAFAEFAKTGKLHFGDLFRYMADEFIKNWVRMQIAGSSNSGTGSPGLLGLIGAIGSFFGPALSVEPGGIPTNNTGTNLPTSGGRAAGGPVTSGGTYLIGERGPELLHMGANSGRVQPMGGNTKVIVNTPAGTRVDRQEERSGPDGREVELWMSQVEGRIASNVARGRSPINAALASRGVSQSAGNPKRG